VTIASAALRATIMTPRVTNARRRSLAGRRER
jgi:hypothetical protein